MFDLICNFLNIHNDTHMFVTHNPACFIQCINCQTVMSTFLQHQAQQPVLRKSCKKHARKSADRIFSFGGQPSTILQMDILAYFLVSSNVDSDAKDDEGPESHTCLQAQTPVFSHKLEILFRFYLLKIIYSDQKVI